MTAKALSAKRVTIVATWLADHVLAIILEVVAIARTRILARHTANELLLGTTADVEGAILATGILKSTSMITQMHSKRLQESAKIVARSKGV